MGRGIVLALLLAATVSGCGDAASEGAGPGVPAASPTAALPADGEVRTVTTVLDDGDGPVMCLAGASWTEPPECQGPAVAGGTGTTTWSTSRPVPPGVTDDLAGAEVTIREVWGGPLCVSRVAKRHARLREVAEELRDLPGNLTPQFGTISNRVDLPVIHDDGSIQAWVDQEYGPDVVEVTSALEPVA